MRCSSPCVAILEYALATKQTQLVAHFFNKVDDWSASWGLSVAASRKLLQNFAAMLEQEGDKSVTTKALVKYFQTYKSDNASYPAEVEKLITTAVLSAVNSPVDAFADRVALLEVSCSCITCRALLWSSMCCIGLRCSTLGFVLLVGSYRF